MVRAADVVLCGNECLADETRRDGGRAVVLPTCIDTEVFHPRVRAAAVARRPCQNVADAASIGGDERDRRTLAASATTRCMNNARPTTVGWTGSRSTNRYLNKLFPMLGTLAGRIAVRVMSDTTDGLDVARLGDTPFHFTPWSPAVEVTETAGFDIGLMPLPDDPWTRGKCGFKALQYMGLGISAACSPVGVNRDIITDGTNGFLPSNDEAWRSALLRLASDAALRERIGAAGRRRVEEAYSLSVIGPRTVDAVEEAVAAAPRRAVG